MDPNQIIGMGVDAYNALDNESKHALAYPSAKTLGLAIDGLVTLTCYPLLKARIFTQGRLKQYQKEVSNKIDQIPEKNRDRSKLGLAIKAIEESRYQLNEDDVRQMYVNLISSTVDNRKNNEVTPRLATVVAQFGPEEAEFLKTIYKQIGKQMPLGYLTVENSENIHKRKATNYLCSSDDGSYLGGKDESIDILNSLGIIEVKDNVWLSAPIYDSRYQTIENVLRNSTNEPLGKNESFKLSKCYLKLNVFGLSLCHCIFE